MYLKYLTIFNEEVQWKESTNRLAIDAIIRFPYSSVDGSESCMVSVSLESPYEWEVWRNSEFPVQTGTSESVETSQRNSFHYISTFDYCTKFFYYIEPSLVELIGDVCEAQYGEIIPNGLYFACESDEVHSEYTEPALLLTSVLKPKLKYHLLAEAFNAQSFRRVTDSGVVSKVRDEQIKNYAYQTELARIKYNEAIDQLAKADLLISKL